MLPKHYIPSEIEEKWYEQWQEKGCFKSTIDDREPYTIVMPPPNVTGVLHMGHLMDNAIQDILIRKARMEGKNACWVPGTDHASIATEAKVVKRLRERGLTKSQLGREKFLEHAWEWKQEFGDIILNQLKKLGASCDWDRLRFTMEPDLYKSVIKVFVQLYNSGQIYKKKDMVNWDPKAQTTLSNEEVIHKDEETQFVYVKYQLENSHEHITVATTRAETILGDTAICVHPDDERYKALIGKNAIVPVAKRLIPIIADKYVDMELGTGALKITPAHDPNDKVIGETHGLEIIDILNADGTVVEGMDPVAGLDRKMARDKMVELLKEEGAFVKTEPLIHKVGYSERNPDTVIEPRLSTQWFVDMKKMVVPALENVMNDEVAFFPKRFKNSYKVWLDGIRDWPISRQLWWGQRIPAWYLPNGEFVVAENEQEALKLAQEKEASLSLKDLKQDEDVLDTWFSSWLWPISVFNGINEPDNEEFKYYYPTTVLVTGWDIIFFWVARMVFAGYEFAEKRPFEHVYFHGMVRDSQRRKMSKTLGNSPDLLKLIENYGADAVRFGGISAAPAGNDILFDEKLCEQGKNFGNKIWNALRLVEMWRVDDQKINENQQVTEWFEHKLNAQIAEQADLMKEYRLSEALMSLYSFIWNDFCSWYLELIKPAFSEAGPTIDSETAIKTKQFFGTMMKLLHPFMPFVTEEIWQYLALDQEAEHIIVSEYPIANTFDQKQIDQVSFISDLISKLREVRKKHQLKRIDEIDLYLITEASAVAGWEKKIKQLAGVKSIRFEAKDSSGLESFNINAIKAFVDTGKEVDKEKELETAQQELKRLQAFVNGIDKKLSNERFLANAPEKVVELEKKKLEDGNQKIKNLEEVLEMYKN